MEVEESPQHKGKGHTGRFAAADCAVADDAMETGVGACPEGEDARLFFGKRGETAHDAESLCKALRASYRGRMAFWGSFCGRVKSCRRWRANIRSTNLISIPPPLGRRSSETEKRSRVFRESGCGSSRNKSWTASLMEPNANFCRPLRTRLWRFGDGIQNHRLSGTESKQALNTPDKRIQICIQKGKKKKIFKGDSQK